MSIDDAWDEKEKFWGVNSDIMEPDAQYFQKNPYAVMTQEEIDVVLKKTTDPVMKSVLNQIDKIYEAHKNDNMVNSPKHYRIGKYELIDFLDELAVHGGYSAVEWGYVLSILQYVCRAPNKNGLQDYKKAKWYLTRLVEMLEAKEKNG